VPVSSPLAAAKRRNLEEGTDVLGVFLGGAARSQLVAFFQRKKICPLPNWKTVRERSKKDTQVSKRCPESNVI